MIARRNISLVAVIWLIWIVSDTSTAKAQDAAASPHGQPILKNENTRARSNDRVTPRFRIKDTAFVSAYRDVSRILQHQSTCSEFFGGLAAVEVLDQLAEQVTMSYTDEDIGIRMFGVSTVFHKNGSSLSYRLFQKVEINGRGSFFHQNIVNGPRTPPIGRFAANTREARALMLLHELGHLIQFSPGHWLLPNDGGNGWQSNENTATVEKYCDPAIRALAVKQ
jgi:hypothetical protein